MEFVNVFPGISGTLTLPAVRHNMFKKLKDKIAEEVKSSPNRIQQLAQAAQVSNIAIYFCCWCSRFSFCVYESPRIEASTPNELAS